MYHVRIEPHGISRLKLKSNVCHAVLREDVNVRAWLERDKDGAGARVSIGRKVRMELLRRAACNRLQHGSLGNARVLVKSVLEQAVAQQLLDASCETALEDVLETAGITLAITIDNGSPRNVQTKEHIHLVLAEKMLLGPHAARKPEAGPNIRGIIAATLATHGFCLAPCAQETA
eukprot:scaffold36660_cov33-Tisochrysis_lutea.AAC.2